MTQDRAWQVKTKGKLKMQVKRLPFFNARSPDNDPPRKCVADRRDKLTDQVNQRINHNQERRAGPEDHGGVANLEHCPKPMEPPAPPHVGLIVDKYYFCLARLHFLFC